MLAVVAHDAGAANHIFAWLRTGLIDATQACLCLEGPALEIYLSSHPGFVNTSLEDAFIDATTVISGTGWASDLEHRARQKAQKMGLKSIAIIDHWCNYLMRFERKGEYVLPDQIWVSDEYAVALCEHLFENIEIVQQPNALLAEQLHELEILALPQQDKILFLMEPARDNWGHPSLEGEFQAFDFFVRHIHQLADSPKQEVVIKPHPSDPQGKYDHLLTQYPDIKLSIDTASSLPAMISEASVVVGCQTYAMVIALHADKKVISVLPPYAPKCVLPQNNIVHLSKLVANK